MLTEEHVDNFVDQLQDALQLVQREYGGVGVEFLVDGAVEVVDEAGDLAADGVLVLGENLGEVVVGRGFQIRCQRRRLKGFLGHGITCWQPP